MDLSGFEPEAPAFLKPELLTGLCKGDALLPHHKPSLCKFVNVQAELQAHYENKWMV